MLFEVVMAVLGDDHGWSGDEGDGVYVCRSIYGYWLGGCG